MVEWPDNAGEGNYVCPVVTLRPDVTMSPNAAFYTETATATYGMSEQEVIDFGYDYDSLFELTDWNLNLANL